MCCEEKKIGKDDTRDMRGVLVFEETNENVSLRFQS